jgi:hypothetical protein
MQGRFGLFWLFGRFGFFFEIRNIGIMELWNSGGLDLFFDLQGLD